MMKSIAIISLLTTAVFAQSSSSSAAAAASSSSSLIPSGISSACSTFLSSLNSNSDLYACTAPLVSATSQFGPGANSTNSTTSKATLSTALNSLCSTASSGCSDSTIRTQLANFYTACTPELTSSPSDAVIQMYDVLYAITPLKEAVCSKDDSGSYCVTELSSASNSSASGVANAAADPTSTQGVSNLQKYLWSSSGASKRDVSAVGVMPNSTTYTQSNVLFLLLSPSTPSAQLCTTCTRKILTQYINFESSVPYGPGLNKSSIMSGQSALYSGVQSTCGSSFMGGAVQAIGGLSGGVLGSGAGKTMSVEGGALGIVVAALSVVAAGFAVAL